MDVFGVQGQLASFDSLVQPRHEAIGGNCTPQSFTILPGVGHDPMIDDAALVARTILGVTGAG